MTYTYEWETCLMMTDEWARMIKRRNSRIERTWRMVSCSVTRLDNGDLIGYVVWESRQP